MKVVYSPAAEGDLDEIAAYTLTVWGPRQCEHYLGLLQECCERVLPILTSAREVPGRPRLLRYRCERHILYFRRLGDTIKVTRVLHERMLPEKHL